MRQDRGRYSYLMPPTKSKVMHQKTRHGEEGGGIPCANNLSLRIDMATHWQPAQKQSSFPGKQFPSLLLLTYLESRRKAVPYGCIDVQLSSHTQRLYYLTTRVSGYRIQDRLQHPVHTHAARCHSNLQLTCSIYSFSCRLTSQRQQHRLLDP